MIRLTKKIVLYLHLLLLTAISLQALDVVSSSPKDGQKGIPINTKIKIQFNEGFDTTRLMRNSFITKSKYSDGFRIPFYLVKKGEYTSNSSFNYLFNKKVDGKYYYDLDDNTITFTPLANEINYETEYLILFNSWERASSNILNMQLDFVTTSELHYITSTSKNIKSELVNCKDSLVINFNRSIPQKVFDNPDFIKLQILAAEVENQYGEIGIMDDVEFTKRLIDDDKVIVITPKDDFHTGKQYQLEINGQSLTGSKESIIQYKLSTHDKYVIDYRVKFQTTVSNYSDTNEIINSVRTGRLVYNYDEKINYSAPEISGDYYFDHWESSNEQIYQFVNRNKIEGIPFDCSNAPSEVALFAVYKPVKIDTLSISCFELENAKVTVKGFTESLGNGNYAIKRFPSSALEVSVRPDRGYIFGGWNTGNLSTVIDIDTISPDLYITSRMMISNPVTDLREWMELEAKKKELGCGTIRKDIIDNYGLEVVLNTFNEFEENGIDHQFAIECGGPDATINSPEWGELMRNFVAVDVDGARIGAGEWEVTGPGGVEYARARWSKRKSDKVFDIVVKILPPYDQEWEVEYLQINDTRGMNEFPEGHNFDNIYLSSLPFADQVIADDNLRNVKVVVNLRKKMHKLTYEILPNVDAGFRVIDSKWKIDEDVKLTTFYEKRGVRFRQSTLASDGSKYTWSGYLHHKKVVNLIPTNTPILPGTGEIDISKINWLAPLQGTVNPSNKVWTATMNEDKDATIMVEDVFRCTHIRIEEEGSAVIDYPIEDPKLSTDYRAAVSAGVLRGITLLFNKVVKSSSLSTIKSSDVSGIRPMKNQRFITVDARLDCAPKIPHYELLENFPNDVFDFANKVEDGTKVTLKYFQTTFGNQIAIKMDQVQSIDNEFNQTERAYFCVQGPKIRISARQIRNGAEFDGWFNYHDEFKFIFNAIATYDYMLPDKKIEYRTWETKNQVTLPIEEGGEYQIAQNGGVLDFDIMPVEIFLFNNRIKSKDYTIEFIANGAQIDDNSAMKSFVKIAAGLIGAAVAVYTGDYVTPTTTAVSIGTAVNNLIPDKEQNALRSIYHHLTQLGSGNGGDPYGAWGGGPCLFNSVTKDADGPASNRTQLDFGSGVIMQIEVIYE